VSELSTGPAPGVVTGRPAMWLRVEALAIAVTALVVGLLHIGVDRAMKYGLKYDHSFAITHLGVHGAGAGHRRAASASADGLPGSA
jgi:hypothetical protein